MVVVTSAERLGITVIVVGAVVVSADANVVEMTASKTVLLALFEVGVATAVIATVSLGVELVGRVAVEKFVPALSLAGVTVVLVVVLLAPPRVVLACHGAGLKTNGALVGTTYGRIGTLTGAAGRGW